MVSYGFDDEYWLQRDEDGESFQRTFTAPWPTAAGLASPSPEEYGGAGLGVAEAAIMMHEVSSHGGGMAAASSVHVNLFGPHPIVVHGTPAQKAEWIPGLVAGAETSAVSALPSSTPVLTPPASRRSPRRCRAAIWSTAKGVGPRRRRSPTSLMLLTRTTRYEDARRPTDGITIFYTDLDRAKIEVRRIPKMGRKAVDSNAIFIDGLFIPEAHRIGEEGKGFSYILDSLNPERVLIGMEAIGIGQDALRRAANYARERVVFGRPIGQNQGIQHPLAERWMYLEAAYLMALRAADLYDHGEPCGAEANAAKFLGARAGS